MVGRQPLAHPSPSEDEGAGECQAPANRAGDPRQVYGQYRLTGGKLLALLSYQKCNEYLKEMAAGGINKEIVQLSQQLGVAL